MFAASLVSLLLAQGAPDPDLTAAQAAFDDAHYEEVLPRVRRALDHPLADSERKHAFELEALAQAAFDERRAAVEAFRRVLGLEPGYVPDLSLGPKVRTFWEQASRLGPLGGPAVPLPRPEPSAPPPSGRPAPLPPAARPRAEPPPPAEPPLYERWYFWAGAGGVAGAAAIGIAAAVLNHPTAPSGNLGTGALR